MHKKLTATIHILMIALLFLGGIAVLLVANYLVSVDQDPYDTLFARLQPSFYIRTILILLLSSLLYTPISYGFSYYSWQGTCREVGLRDFWFLFSRPLLFGKTVLLRMAVWFVRGFYQLLILLCGVLGETVLYVVTLRLKSKEVLTLSLSQLPQHIDAILGEKNFLWFTVIIWSIILILLLVTVIRFMFCKFALLRYPELSVGEALRIGIIAGRGEVMRVIRHYLSIVSYYIIMVLSIGRFKSKIAQHKRQPFSLYAIGHTERARKLYFAGKMSKSLDK